MPCCPNDKKSRGLSRLLFFFIGIGSTLWFLLRVLPKPSRAAYPCMRVAAPMASAFVLYLLGLFASIAALRQFKKHLHQARFVLAFFFLLVFIGALAWIVGTDSLTVSAGQVLEPNQPMGEAQGIFPGRVVWIHNPNATNENCVPTRYGHSWFLNENNNQTVIDEMLTKSLQAVSGHWNIQEAWQAVFKYHNARRGKADLGYQTGEKIFIKINATSSWGNFATTDLSITYNSYYGISETSPQLVLAVLRQLVQVVGVAEKDIYIGDPMRHIYKHNYELWHGEFPQVNFLDPTYGADKGRVKEAASATPTLFYSDRGQVLGSSHKSETLYDIYYNVEYVINIPTLKGHSFAGVTMFAKNHFGSITSNGASHLHNGLVATVDRGVVTRPGYGLYRVQVDLMGHNALSGKNLFYLLDGLWSADYEIGSPRKYLMAPFNNDWMSSIFLSLDPVAIESVGYDFLHTEFDGRHGDTGYPQMDGTDDYLHQAADSRTWPASIRYDPENDGTVLTSLGVHEHWNNVRDMQYSRNLGTGSGIELIRWSATTEVGSAPAAMVRGFHLNPVYPNPFNPSAQISFALPSDRSVRLEVYSMLGEHVATLVNGRLTAGSYHYTWDAGPAAAGVYFFVLQTGRERLVQKAVLAR
jgi:hypothetical protein